MDKALTRARALLLGSQFTRIEYDDSWRLSTERDVWLSAHRLQARDETDIRAALVQAFPWLLASTENEVTGTATALFGILRSTIVEIGIDDAGALHLTLANGTVSARTDVDAVDWQWSLSRDRGPPHHSFEVACFERGSVVLG